MPVSRPAARRTVENPCRATLYPLPWVQQRAATWMKSEAVLLVTIVALFSELRQELESKLQATQQLQWIVELRSEDNGGRARTPVPPQTKETSLASSGPLLLEILRFAQDDACGLSS